MRRPLLAVKRKDLEGLPLQICKSQGLELQPAASCADSVLIFTWAEASKVTALVVLVPSSHKFKSESDSSFSFMNSMSQVTLSQKLSKEQLHVWTSSCNFVASYQTWYMKLLHLIKNDCVHTPPLQLQYSSVILNVWTHKWCSCEWSSNRTRGYFQLAHPDLPVD